MFQTMQDSAAKEVLETNECIKVPLLLFEHRFKELTPYTKLLYAILLDDISKAKERGNVDEKGRCYTTCSRKRVEKLLGVEKRTITKLFRNLIAAGLIEIEGTNDFDRKIYVSAPKKRREKMVCSI